MTVQDILNYARLRLDDVVQDAKGSYLWNDAELLSYYNQSRKDLARGALFIHDSETVSVCKYIVYANQPLLVVSPLIVQFNAGYLDSNKRPLGRKTVQYFDRHIAMWGYQSTGWRMVTEQPLFYIPNYEKGKIRWYPYYGATYQGTTYELVGVADVTFVKTGSLIQRASGLSIFKAGKYIKVTGSLSNDGTYLVLTSSDTQLGVSGTLVNESTSSPTIDSQVDTAYFEVSRLPLTDLVMADVYNAVSDTEIPDQYLMHMIDGILSWAFLKRDAETYNIKEADKYRGIFQDFIDDVRKDQIVLEEDDPNVFEPAYGAI